MASDTHSDKNLLKSNQIWQSYDYFKVRAKHNRPGYIFFLNFGQKLSEIYFFDTKQNDVINCGLGHACVPRIVKIGQKWQSYGDFKFNDPKI